MGRLTYTTAEVQERLDSVGQMVRPNLLDNWYFVGGGSQGTAGAFPINQRGETSYTGNKYGIDRWRAWNANITVTLTSGGLTIRNTDSSASQQITQYFSAADTAILTGQTVTMSALIDGVIYSATGVCGTLFSIYPPSMTLQCVIANGGLVAFQMWTAKNATTGTIQAVKFELGDTQTLAHWDDATQTWILNEVPNFGDQLARCERYYYAMPNYVRFPTTRWLTSEIEFLIPVPVTMRNTPTIVGTPVVYSGNTAQSGFTFAMTGMGNNALAIRASKASHGLTDEGVSLYVAGTALSADL